MAQSHSRYNHAFIIRLLNKLFCILFTKKTTINIQQKLLANGARFTALIAVFPTQL